MHQRGYPLSHQAPQPEQTALPPTANGALDATSPARAAAPTPSRGYLFASKRPQPVNTDRWYYRVFQSAPDLIRALLPGSEAGLSSELGLDPRAPGDRLYRFEALEIKELSHRLDGVLWPRESTGCAETGSPESSRWCCLRCRCTPTQASATQKT